MTTTKIDRSDDGADPQAQLAMLETVQNATEAEAWMPPTPIWHAPILATAIAGISLIDSGRDGWAIAGAVVGGTALVVGVVDQARRQRVSPRRMRKPARVLAFYGFVLVVSLIIGVAWSVVDLPDGSVRAVLALAAGWLATSAAFAVGITITNRMRNNWTRPPQ